MPEKKLCPMKRAIPPDIYDRNDNRWACDKERCAWWVIDKCAIPQLAAMALDYVHPRPAPGRKRV